MKKSFWIIKNRKGKYLHKEFAYFGFDLWTDEMLDAAQFQNKDYAFDATKVIFDETFMFEVAITEKEIQP